MNNVKHELTKEGYKKIEERVRQLNDVELPRVVEAIKEARAQGDLSENAEYDAARDEQAAIVAEIEEKTNILKNCIIIDEEAHTNNIGKTVTVFIEKLDTTMQFTIKSSSLEVNPLENIISRESPFGKAILDAKVGDRVAVKPDNGDEYYVVIKDIQSANESKKN